MNNYFKVHAVSATNKIQGEKIFFFNTGDIESQAKAWTEARQQREMLKLVSRDVRVSQFAPTPRPTGVLLIGEPVYPYDDTWDDESFAVAV